MSLVVTQRPSVTDTETSTWNAVGNPVLYKMQRKDFIFNQVNNNGGFVQLQFNGVDITGSFANGDSLYVKSDNDVYDSFGEQTAEAFSGGNTLITTDIPYVSAAPGGFCNNDTLRPLYRVEVEVYNSDDELLNEAPFVYSPTSKGALAIDISAILRANLLPDINFDLTGTTEVFEDTNFLGFYIKYREVWTGSAESQTDDVANQFYAVFAANQIPAPYGGNMLDYIITNQLVNGFDDTDLTTWTNESGAGVDWTTGTAPDVSLTNGQASDELRRAISISDSLGYQIAVFVTIATNPLDSLKLLINGVEQHEWTSLSVGNSTKVNAQILNEVDITSIGFVASQTSSGNTSITITRVVFGSAPQPKRILTNFERLVIWHGFPNLFSFINESNAVNIEFPTGTLSESVSDGIYAIRIPDDIDEDFDLLLTGGVLPISISIPVEVRTPCANPIMLIGRNKQGGILQWVFEYSQEYTFDYGNDIKAKRLVLRATGVTINDWEALQDFITLGQVYQNNIVELTNTTNKTSTRVGQQVYVLEPDGTMTGVIVIPTRNSTETKLKQHFFEIEIEYPQVFAL